MSLKQSRVCDVFGKHGASHYRITVEKMQDDAPLLDDAPEAWVKTFQEERDLGNQGISRLVRWIERGLRKPGTPATEPT